MTEDDQIEKLEKLKEARAYSKRNSGKLQMQISTPEIEFLSDNGCDMRTMHRKLIEKKQYTGCYETFIKNLKDFLPAVHQKYTRKKL